MKRRGHPENEKVKKRKVNGLPSDSLKQYVDFIHQKNNKAKNWLSTLWNSFNSFMSTPLKDVSHSDASDLELKLLKKIIKERLQKLYPDILTLIRKFLLEAKAQNKPLLLLIGERHNVLSGSIVEAFILQILADSNEFLLKNIYTEAFEASTYTDDKFSGVSTNTIEQQIKYLKLKKIPIDLAVTNIHSPMVPEAHHIIDNQRLLYQTGIHNIGQAVLKRGMRIRNQIMADVMSAFKEDGNALAIVGNLHLYGLMKETNLKEAYYVVPFLTQRVNHPVVNDLYDETCIKYIETSKKVNRLFFSSELVSQNLEPSSFFTSQDIIEMIQESVIQSRVSLL